MHQGSPGSHPDQRGGRRNHGWRYLLPAALLLAALALLAACSGQNPGGSGHIEAPGPLASQHVLDQPSPAS